MTRPLKLSDLPPSVQRRVRLEQMRAGAKGAKVRRAERRPDGFDSKGEAAFALHLEAERGCRLPNWRYHAVVLTLPGGTKYRPDFVSTFIAWNDAVESLTLRPSPEAPARFLESATVYEVCAARRKGWRGQGSKEAQAVRIRECAAAYPWLHFMRVRPIDGGWSFQKVGGESARAS